ncbi:MAG: ankyrin repeat domain-containing protein [Microcoleaceae cyanobacterium]
MLKAVASKEPHPSEFQMTALMSAAGNGQKQVVEILLERGADMTAKDKNNWTALVWAASENHTEVVEQLKQARSRT